jgi:hypothetical protein
MHTHKLIQYNIYCIPMARMFMWIRLSLMWYMYCRSSFIKKIITFQTLALFASSHNSYTLLIGTYSCLLLLPLPLPLLILLRLHALSPWRDKRKQLLDDNGFPLKKKDEKDLNRINIKKLWKLYRQTISKK